MVGVVEELKCRAHSLQQQGRALEKLVNRLEAAAEGDVPGVLLACLHGPSSLRVKHAIVDNTICQRLSRTAYMLSETW